MAEIEVIEVEVAGAPDVIELFVPGLQGPAGATEADGVSFDPAGNIAATNVQDAIVEAYNDALSTIRNGVTSAFDTLLEVYNWLIIRPISVADAAYGAVGDDSTVNTTAIQAALDSGKAWIYVPEGIFRHAQLTWPSTVKRIYGPGTLKGTGSISNFLIVTGTGVTDAKIDGVTIDLDPVTYSAVAAVAFSGAVNTKASDVYFKNSGRQALQIRGTCLNCGIEKSRIEGFAQFAVSQIATGGASTGSFVHDNKIKNTASCTSHIVSMLSGIGDDVSGNKIDGNGSPEFGIFEGDAVKPNVHDNDVKNTTKEAVHFGSTTSGKIRDNDCDWPDNASADFGISVAPDGASAAAATDTQIGGNNVKRAGKSAFAVAGNCPGGSMVGNTAEDPNQLAGANPTPTHSNGFELYGAGAEDWHVAANTAISNDGNMTYGFSEVPTEAGADNNTFEGNRSSGHATGEVNLSGASSKWNQPTISPDEAYGSSWNGKLEAPTKNSVYDAIGDITSFGRSLVDDAAAVNARGTLELATTTTDNAIIRADGTAGKTQTSLASIDDNGIVAAPKFYSFSAASLADDAATSFTPGGALVFSVLHILSSGGSPECGIIFARVTSAATQAIVVGASIQLTTGALTGTTGTDGKLVISTHTDGKIYIENRTGGVRNVVLWLQGL